jgi:hypothetical protein
MLAEHAIFVPAIAMTLLIAIVWVRLYQERIGELRSRRIHPQQIATSRAMAETMQNVKASDHFRNLFEVPVLFYVLCGFLAITKLTTPLLLACAWGFVLLRAYHAYIHLTHNKVIRRFQAYVASTTVLWVMWAIFAVRLLTTSS